MEKMTPQLSILFKNQSVRTVLSQSVLARGVEKHQYLKGRIAVLYRLLDQNRELLELLCREAPSVLTRNPHLVSYVREQDEFLHWQALQLVSSESESDIGAVTEWCPNIRPWPIPENSTVEQYLSHEKFGKSNNQSKCYDERLPSAKPNEEISIRDYYQRALQIKLSELEMQLEKSEPQSSEHQRLLIAIEQVRHLIISWNKISDLVVPPAKHSCDPR